MRAIVLAIVVAVALAGVGGATAQSGMEVVVEAPGEVTAGSTIEGELRATGVSNPDGVGSYTIELAYDPAVVSVTASDGGEFDVETSTPQPGVLRIVGYTGEYPGPTGSVTLAAVQITGEATGQSSLSPTTELLTDADGNVMHPDSDVATTVSVASAGGDTGIVSGGSTGGSGSASESTTPTDTPSTPTEPTATPDSVPTPTPSSDETAGEGTTDEEATTETPSPSQTDTETPIESEDQPGFGALLAIAALGASAATLLRRR